MFGRAELELIAAFYGRAACFPSGSRAARPKQPAIDDIRADVILFENSNRVRFRAVGYVSGGAEVTDEFTIDLDDLP